MSRVSSLCVLGLLAAALLCVVPTVHARTHAHHSSLITSNSTQQLQQDACGGQDYGKSGDFDYYVFAQSWPAAFCQQHRDWPGCSKPTAWQRVNLTLHGMWPNYNKARDGHNWPQCCQSKYGNNIDVNVAKSLLPAFQTYWPNEQDPSGGSLASSLWAHEWQKHGTCSGLDQRTYFTTAMTIELQMGTPSALSKNVGGKAALKDLKAAFRMTSCSDRGDCLTGLACSGKGSEQQLTGVTTCWNTASPPKQIVCPSASLPSESQRCSSEQIRIPAF